MLSRFHLIPERYGQTNGRTDRQTDLLYQYRASVLLTRDKNDLENEVNNKKIKGYNTTTGFEHTTYAIKPEHLAIWTMAAVGDIGLKVNIS